MKTTKNKILSKSIFKNITKNKNPNYHTDYTYTLVNGYKITLTTTTKKEKPSLIKQLLVQQVLDYSKQNNIPILVNV